MQSLRILSLAVIAVVVGGCASQNEMAGESLAYADYVKQVEVPPVPPGRVSVTPVGVRFERGRCYVDIAFEGDRVEDVKKGAAHAISSIAAFPNTGLRVSDDLGRQLRLESTWPRRGELYSRVQWPEPAGMPAVRMETGLFRCVFPYRIDPAPAIGHDLTVRVQLLPDNGFWGGVFVVDSVSRDFAARKIAIDWE